MPIVRANSKTLAIMPVTDQMGRQFPCQSRQLPEKTPVLKPSDAKYGTHYLSASRLNYGKEESPALLLLGQKRKTSGRLRRGPSKSIARSPSKHK